MVKLLEGSHFENSQIFSARIESIFMCLTQKTCKQNDFCHFKNRFYFFRLILKNEKFYKFQSKINSQESFPHQKS